MKADLKTAIRAALAGSSSKNPVDTADIYPLGTRKQVQAALAELYQAREVGFCQVTKGGAESIVWWLAGAIPAPRLIGRGGRTCGK